LEEEALDRSCGGIVMEEALNLLSARILNDDEVCLDRTVSAS
jgi:hypothetical protein